MSGYQSKISPREIVIDDTNAAQLATANDAQFGRGHIARDYSRQPLGSVAGLTKFDLPIPPRSEWEGLIEQHERDGTLSQLVLDSGLPSMNQQQTNYCWINAPVGLMEVSQVVAGGKVIRLSPASGGARIKGFRNVGGWGGEAVEWIGQNGINSIEEWPANAIDRRYDTDATRAAAATRKIAEWYELQPRNFGQLMACLFRRLPVAIGLNWWGHEVYAIDPVSLGNGKFGARCRNSWGDSYGEKGFFILSESKATPDDAVAPRANTVFVK